MKGMAVVLGGIFLFLAFAVLVFSDGLRRWYSGMFFALIGTAMLMNAFYLERAVEE